MYDASKEKRAAAIWLNGLRDSRRFSARDMDLLDRAAGTLVDNILFDEKNAWGPYRGIVPSRSRYQGVWNWDAAFHAVAVSRFDPALAYEQCEIFFAWQGDNGIFPDMIRVDGSRMEHYSKPPVFPWAFIEIYKRSPEPEKLAVAYEKYKRNERFWREQRFDAASGLFYYSAKKINDDWLTHMKWETGMDNSPRWDRGVEPYLAVDLNAYMVMFYDALAYMAQTLHNTADAEVWTARRQETAARINRLLWCGEKKCYLDRDRFTGAFSPVLSSAAFTPLFAQCADAEKAREMARNAADRDLFYPSMPTVAFNDPAYSASDYWRGPAWLNLAYFAVAGLQRCGYATLADEIKETLLDFADREKRGIFEYYNSKTGEGLGAKQFGWSAAFIIELILL